MNALPSDARIFIVHHNPNSGRYRYPADPNDVVASVKVMLREGEATWVAGNCHRMIREGDLLLFKFGGARLMQAPGLYAAAWVTREPRQNRIGEWRFRCRPHRAFTRQLLAAPIIGKDLARVVPRSFGASIQSVSDRGRLALEKLLAEPNATSLTHALLIKKEPLDAILAGTKTWEIRGSATKLRGPIALIESKSGTVVGTCELIDVVGPLSLAELRRNEKRAGFRATAPPYDVTYAWVLRGAGRLPNPVPYKHPSGAIIWVRLEPDVLRKVRRFAMQRCG